MKTLDTGNEKIQKICEAIRVDTLEPAREEAAKIIEEAKEKARKIILEAEKEAEKEIQHARLTIDKEKNVFESALYQASKQALEALRQEIENKLFYPSLLERIESSTKKPEIIADLIKAISKALEKEGIHSDLSAIIPKNASTSEINELLGAAALKELKVKELVLGDFFGGAKLKVSDRNLICDMSDQAIFELLVQFIRSDLRKFFFKQ